MKIKLSNFLEISAIENDVCHDLQLAYGNSPDGLQSPSPTYQLIESFGNPARVSNGGAILTIQTDPMNLNPIPSTVIIRTPRFGSGKTGPKIANGGLVDGCNRELIGPMDRKSNIEFHEEAF